VLETRLPALQRDELARAWARVMSALGHGKSAARLRSAP
jgi:hypothetical protein